MGNTNNKDTGSKKKRRDVILIVVLLIAALTAYFIIEAVVKKQGCNVVVKVDGKVIDTMRLDKNQSIIVKGYNGGSNKVVIEDNMVYMTEADCPDKICINTGKISRTGETIVCLPHRVVVEITKADKSSVMSGADNSSDGTVRDNQPLDSVVK